MNLKTVARFKDAPWFKQYTISIGGCGGIGSWLSLLLSRIGHELILYDPDRIEEANLGGQLYSREHVGMVKATACAKILRYLTENPRIHEAGLFDENCEGTGIMFSCFDNMKARKIFFEKWKTFVDEELLGNGNYNSPYIFIDGRMEAETAILYVIRTREEMALWEKEWFPDENVADAPCTFRATSHNPAILTGLMVAAFNNYIANFIEGQNIRTTPWKVTYQLPTFTFDVLEIETVN